MNAGTLAEKIEALQRFEATVFIDVKLVGFDGEGKLGLTIAEVDFYCVFVWHSWCAFIFDSLVVRLN